jgi:hypothetical protein
VCLSLFLRPTETYLTCGSARALPDREAGSRAMGHVATPEPICGVAGFGAAGHVAVPEPSPIGRWGLEPKDVRQCQSPQLRGDRVWSCGIHGSAGALLNKEVGVWRHGTHGSTGAHLSRKVESRADEHVAARGSMLCGLSCLHACSQGYRRWRLICLIPCGQLTI